MGKKNSSLQWTLKKNNINIEKKTDKESIIIETTKLMNLMEQFLLEADIKENSKKTYFKGLKRFLEWSLNQEEIKDEIKITKSFILQYKTFLSTEAQIKPHTQAICLVAIKQFFVWTEANLILPNIARNIKGIKKITKQHHKDPLSKSQIEILLQNHKESEQNLITLRNNAIIHLLLFTGIRIGEATKIKMNDLDKDNYHYNTTIWIHGKGRSGKDNFVIAIPEVIEQIEKYIEKRKSEGEIITDNSILFISHGRKTKNKPLTSDSISKIINKELKKRNIKTKKTSAHSLRHTFGVNAIEAGISLYDLQIAMRHSTPTTTQVYLGDIEKKKRKEGSTEEKVFEQINKKKDE